MASLFPKVLQDDSNLALEKVTNKVFKFDLKPMMFLFIDHCDERLLPILAKAFHVMGDEGWNFANTIAEKRNLIKNALLIHRYKGTKAALKRVLNIMNIEGEVKEWFEYSGRPMYFKLILKVFDKNFDLETETKLIHLINTFKNTRSKLKALEVFLTSNAKVHTYCRCIYGETVTIRPKGK